MKGTKKRHKPDDRLSDVAIIARDIHPSAFHDGEPWSRDVSEARTTARLAAQKILKDDPERALAILAKHARKTTPKKPFRHLHLERRIAALGNS